MKRDTPTRLLPKQMEKLRYQNNGVSPLTKMLVHVKTNAVKSLLYSGWFPSTGELTIHCNFGVHTQVRDSVDWKLNELVLF